MAADLIYDVPFRLYLKGQNYLYFCLLRISGLIRNRIHQLPVKDTSTQKYHFDR